MSKKTARSRREVVDLSDRLNDFEISNSENWLLDFKLRKPFYLNPHHKQFYNCIMDATTKIAFVDGPAGSMKTYIAVYAALEMILKEDFERLIYIRSVAESAEKSLGSLPGEVDDKFLPYAMPLLEKVREITNESTSKMLRNKGIIEAIPVNFVRGLTFNNSVVIIDEAQNLTSGELTTILTRFGRNSKYVVAGDTNQADIGKKTGFKQVFDKFSTTDSETKGIYSFVSLVSIFNLSCIDFSRDKIVESRSISTPRGTFKPITFTLCYVITYWSSSINWSFFRGIDCSCCD